MNEESRQERNMARLEQKRKMINDRLDAQRTRLETQQALINARLDEKQASLQGKLNLKQSQIVEVALELLKTEGLANLSLRSIARKLDIQAPALYWHFKNKEVLVDYMAEAILQKEFKDLQPRKENETWQEWLTAHMVQLRKAMLAYPDGGRVVAGAHISPAFSLAQSFEVSLVSLRSAGVDMQKARHIIMTTTHYTFGYVIEEQSAPTPEQIAEAQVEQLLAPYPNMREVMSEVFEHYGELNDDFVIGLKYIIDGSSVE